MNRTEILRQVSKETGRPLTEVETVVGSFLETVSDVLLAGEVVNIRRFGKWELRVRRAVTRLNPRTQEKMEIPDKISVAFLPSSTLKAKLNG